MNDQVPNCGAVRRLMQDSILQSGPAAPLPAEIATHLRGCLECAAYQRGLTVGPDIFPQGDYYTSNLRRRTLAAVEETAGRPGFPLGWTLLPLAVLGVVFSLLGPVWAIARLLERWIAVSWQAYATAGGVVLLLGSSTMLIGGLLIFKSRPIQLANGDR